MDVTKNQNGGIATPSSLIKIAGCILGIVIVGLVPVSGFAGANGSLSGTVKDPTGAVVCSAKVTLVSTAFRAVYTAFVANLDSIDELLVLTNSFEPEYGN
jgi:hypothetical protein